MIKCVIYNDYKLLNI